jgi:hypothetical protein
VDPPPDKPPPAAARPSAREVWWLTALVSLGVAFLLYRGLAGAPVLYDGDAYYHLAVARAYAERGMFHTLDWARFSIMHDGFGDKELLFHLLLAPFAALRDASAGGVLALTLLDTAIAATLAATAIAAIGRSGALVPLLVFGTAIDFAMRTVRLRPELLALLLVLAAVSLAARRRAVLLGAAACMFTLAYTAWHAFLGLCLLFWAYGLWVERRNDWRLVVYPAVGVALGLLVHPHFPANLRVWVAQNVQFLTLHGTLEVGPEIHARTTRQVLVLNAGWLAGLAVLWRSRVGGGLPTVSPRARDLTLIAAAVFGTLYLLSGRFVLYAVPLVTLAVVRALGAGGARPGPVVRLPWRGGIPYPLAMTLCLLAAIPATRNGWAHLKGSVERIYRPEMRADWEAFARAMPAGGTVVAPWAATEHLLFWAPQARYLNVLDPLFMFLHDPDLYRLSVDVFEGHEPDLPLVARAGFDSELYADDGQYPYPKARLVADPRVTPLHDGITYLYRFAPDRNANFLLDWKVLPPGAPVPPPLALLRDPTTPSWPRAETAAARALEGYVDGRRLGRAEGCVVFARVEEVSAPTQRLIEFAPYGDAQVFLDDAALAAIPPRAATLGRGVTLPLTLAPGPHRLTVRTCARDGHLGFYALVRG